MEVSGSKPLRGYRSYVRRNPPLGFHPKSGAKATALHTLRDCHALTNRAQHLECARFSAAVGSLPSWLLTATAEFVQLQMSYDQAGGLAS